MLAAAVLWRSQTRPECSASPCGRKVEPVTITLDVLVTADVVTARGGDAGGAYPLGYSSDGQHAGPVEVLVELAGLDEFIILNVFLHLFPRAHKVVVLAVDLVLSPGTGRICGWGRDRSPGGSVSAVLLNLPSAYCWKLTRYTRAELVRKLGDEVVIYSVLHGTQDDHGPRVVDWVGDRAGT